MAVERLRAAAQLRELGAKRPRVSEVFGRSTMHLRKAPGRSFRRRLSRAASYVGPVRRAWPSARAVAWFWAILEGLNGLGHLLRSLWARQYTAGAVTAVPLLVVALVLGARLARESLNSSR
jgi:hypothetical protein